MTSRLASDQPVCVDCAHVGRTPAGRVICTHPTVVVIDPITGALLGEYARIMRKERTLRNPSRCGPEGRLFVRKRRRWWWPW